MLSATPCLVWTEANHNRRLATRLQKFIEFIPIDMGKREGTKLIGARVLFRVFCCVCAFVSQAAASRVVYGCFVYFTGCFFSFRFAHGSIIAQRHKTDGQP